MPTGLFSTVMNMVMAVILPPGVRGLLAVLIYAFCLSGKHVSEVGQSCTLSAQMKQTGFMPDKYKV